MPIKPKIIDQYHLMMQSRPDIRVHPADWLELEEDYEYLYREDALLMRDADVPAVDDFLSRTFRARRLDPDSPEDRSIIERVRERSTVEEAVFLAEPTIEGLTRVLYTGLRDADEPLPEPRSGTERGSVPDLLDRMDEVDDLRGRVRAEAVVHICPVCCPAHEPFEVPLGTADPVPPVAAGCACDPPCDGCGVEVVVVDTGWIRDAARRYWLEDVTGDPEDTIGDDGKIQEYAGHGTFAAGCVRVIAPKAAVTVDGSMTTAGAMYETELVTLLERAMQGEPDRVFVFPFTTTTRDGAALASFDKLYENVIRQKQIDGMVIVSSAGCDDVATPYWPAAYKWVVSVGSLTPDAQPTKADWSNYGPFVDVYVRGAELVNAYATGTLVAKEHSDHHGVHEAPGVEREFHGMAEWGGTSFSTALLGGMIAARKSHTKETAREAAEALLDVAETQFVNGLGPVLRLDQGCVRQR